MKNSILILLAIFVFSCNNDPTKKINQKNLIESKEKTESTDNFPEITFDKKEHDFGTINDGDIVETVFVFTNTGNSDLIISDAQGSCGCTVPDYPKNVPIKPGDKGDIKVKFDSTKKPGNQMKTVTLTTNTKRGRDIIRIKTNVVSPLSN